MITDHARLLAREVISRACESYASGAIAGDLDYIRAVVIHTRWPVRGRGGIARGNARTQREVRAAIAEFYQPPYLPEKKHMSLCACNESYQCADCVRAELKDLCSERDRYIVECRTLSTELVNCQQDRDNAHAELTNAKATISRLEDEIIELNIFHEMDKET